MPVYNGKLLELVAIKKNSDKYFLHIRFSFKQAIEMDWEIDEYTAENLNKVVNFDGKCKYRVTFHISRNPLHKRHISILTRTYREKSEQIYFLCSDDFINNLIAIKNLQHIDDLAMLPFITTNLPSICESSDKAMQEHTEIITYKKYNLNSVASAILIISLIFVILLSYSSHANLINKAEMNEKALSQTMVSDSIILEDVSLDNVPIEQPVIPFVELEEELSYSIPKGNVALTFDDGPSKYSLEIMNILKNYGVGGTFFFIGLNVEKYPEYVENIHSNGYSIGSHSMNHSNLSVLSNENLNKEIVQSSKVLEEITNEKVILFRPPYGAINDRMLNLLHEHGNKIVLWNNDPKDWKNYDSDKILNEIQTSDVSGSIILLHESQAIIDILPSIIEYLLELDLKIVSLK